MNIIITDMEGDAIGDCTDCEAHYESMGEKAPCDKCPISTKGGAR